MTNPKLKKSLLLKGLLTFGIGFFVNMIFMLIGIGGLLREGARLITLIGLLVIIIGAFQGIIKIFKKNQ